MNEQFELNSEAIQAWLDKDDRKQSFLVKRLDVSGSLVAQMLSEQRHVPKEKTLKALAELMGVEVSTLLIPREATKAS